MSQLTIAHQPPTTLIECETIISTQLNFGRQSAALIGATLQVIRDQALYKKGAYQNFADYCRETWGFEKSRVSQMLVFSELLEDLKGQLAPAAEAEDSTIVELPDLESHARSLTSVPKGDRGKVWRKVLEELPTNTRITARHVEKVVMDWMTENQPRAMRMTVRSNRPIEVEPTELAVEKIKKPTDEEPLDESLDIQELEILEPEELDLEIDTLTTAIRTIEVEARTTSKGVIGSLTDLRGGSYDFIILTLEALHLPISKALEIMKGLLSPGSRIAIGCRPMADYAVVKAAEKLGWRLEHSIVESCKYSDHDRGLFFPRHQVTLVFNLLADTKLREPDLDAAKTAAGGFVVSSNTVINAYELLLAAYTRPGDRVLCPTADIDPIIKSIDRECSTTYLCCDQTELAERREQVYEYLADSDD